MTYQDRIDAKASEIELLTAYANGVTGQDDSNIGDAIKTLCDGFGGGGGVLTIEYTPVIDVRAASNVYINHGLAKVPSVIIAVTDDELDDYTGATSYVFAGIAFVDKKMSMAFRKTNSIISAVNSSTSTVAVCDNIDDTRFRLTTTSTSYYWMANKKITFYLF